MEEFVTWGSLGTYAGCCNDGYTDYSVLEAV